ncbi:MAG TPA: molybdenum cofactor biosynthesis protein MoaE [Nitrososphaerales archaeon]|nr:molybdenum cofactor biosynthesis protein MoaE [Nitrososphaerales archaeon]
MSRTRMITASVIDPSKVLRSVQDRSAGGTVMFVGTIRNQNEGKPVTGLRYDVYRTMAEKKMQEIESKVRSKWPVKKMTMVHRYGSLKVGEVSVAVAVSCEHRAQAFEACRFAIDAIKRTVPLWKKEMSKGRKEKWVEGTLLET